MFILNQTNDNCIKIDRLMLLKLYKPEVQSKINSIREHHIRYSYNYGSTEKANRHADMEIDEFLSNHENPYIHVITVNGSSIEVAKYETRREAERIYNKIIECMDKRTNNVIRISELEK